jgi:hypothetical protein
MITEEKMELGKGWKQWDVSLDYIPVALTQLKENGVKEYIIVPVMREEDKAGRRYCYNIFYYNEKDSTAFINEDSSRADSVTFEPLVRLAPSSAKLILELRDSIIAGGFEDWKMQDVYRILYKIADPTGTSFDPWKELEKLAAQA